VKKAVIFDLDGTLCNFEHRSQLYYDGELEKFYALLHKDKCSNWCKELMDAMLYRGYQVLIVTARPEKYRQQTADWLLRHGIRYHELLMALGGQEQNNAEAKKYIYQTKIEKKYQVLFAIEDRSQVVSMWRKLGITCLQCADGQY
jgi:phosphoglycolate phosphatase-like HAD superfamily hydrolase